MTPQERLLVFLALAEGIEPMLQLVHPSLHQPREAGHAEPLLLRHARAGLDKVGNAYFPKAMGRRGTRVLERLRELLGEATVPSQPLLSVFSVVSLFDRQGSPRTYRLAPLQADWNVLAPGEEREVSEEGATPPGHEAESYAKHAERFLGAWDDLMGRCQLLTPPFAVFLEWCLTLVRRYLWCVPVSRESPDVPLCDHLQWRMALALVSYRRRGAENAVLVKGNVVNVQNFVYDLSSPGGGAGTARILRGRSTFLTLLTECAARHMVHELGLSPANILQLGGGEFLLMAPAKAEERIAGWHAAWESWLLQAFRSGLGLAVAAQVFPLRDLFDDPAACLDEVTASVEAAKFRRFDRDLAAIPGDEKRAYFREAGEPCRVCGTFPRDPGSEAPKEIGACDPCGRFWRLGGLVPELSGVVFSGPVARKAEALDWRFVFGGMGEVRVATGSAAHLLSKTATGKSAWAVQHVTLGEGALGLAPQSTVVPRVLDRTKIDERVRYHLEAQRGERIENGGLASFGLLACASQGDALLGVLRADADHMGTILAFGVPEETRTFPTVTALSRMTAWFFGGIIDQTAREIGTSPEDASHWRYLALDGQVYVGYAGGDDLFAVGPWDMMVDFALEVRRRFKAYTGSNGPSDLSAGLFTCHATFPIGRAARIAEHAEQAAKDAGGGRIHLLGSVVTWEIANLAVQLGMELASAIQRDSGSQMNRRVLFKMLDAVRQARAPALVWPLLYHAVATSARPHEQGWIIEHQLKALEQRLKQLEGGGRARIPNDPQTAADQSFATALQVALVYAKMVTERSSPR